MDREKIKKAVTLLLEGIGEDPTREGLVETPDRVARMCDEVLAGTAYSNEDIARMFGKSFEQETDDDDYVLMDNITAFSYCEHHLALMYNMSVSVAYIPHGKVIGLSKIARIVDMCSKRLQLQEKLGADIAEVMQIATGSDDVAVVITGSHSCMTARGIKKPDAVTKTTTFRGRFKTDEGLQKRLIMQIGR